MGHLLPPDISVPILHWPCPLKTTAVEISVGTYGRAFDRFQS